MKKQTFKITSRLGRLMLWYDYTTICDDMKFAYVPDPGNDKLTKDRVKRVIELTNPIDYTQDEIKKNFDLNTKVIKWEHTFTEDGKPTMAVVLDKRV